MSDPLTLLDVPASVDADGTTWTVQRAWPHRGDVALELARPDVPDVRAAVLTPGSGVRLSPAGQDRRLPGLSEAARDGVVVSHRAGRRAVVRSTDGRRFTKVVRPGGAAALVRAMGDSAALAERLRTPPVLAVHDDRVVLGALEGSSLLDLATSPRVADAWRAWAEAWPEVVAGPTSPTGTVHDAAAEVEVLRTWARRAALVLDPDTCRRLVAVVDAVEGLLLTGRAGPLVVAHRDLHDQQLLWAPGQGVGVLDVDTACRAEASLDLGNLRAHVTLRRLQGLYPGSTADLAHAGVDDVAATLAVDPERVRVHELATLTRLVGVYAFRPRWRHVARTLLDRLDGGETAARGWAACSTSS